MGTYIFLEYKIIRKNAEYGYVRRMIVVWTKEEEFGQDGGEGRGGR